VPTLVIHGEADPLVDQSGGKATAAAVPGSELMIIPGMGHDLPRQTWPTIVGGIVRNARSAA
jgi:pimeloyl-ACP methyl ester carboxylesterase